jgi:beta-glucosidase-like glycosyl hydrolase
MDKRKIAQLIIARLDGDEISRGFRYYQSLVREGIGGFIIFGGDAREVRDGIRRLQKGAEYPLFIASDLEQGLGQQIRGGTTFPPPMAIASAIDRNSREDVSLLRDVIDAIAIEAKAVGINLILAPVADVNTNPENPIICTRAFSDRPEVAGWFVKEYIKGLQRHGIMACVKHFPGHGDTSVDSHLAVPIVKTDRRRLHNVELYPFRAAIEAGVGMVMVGHIVVPAIDETISPFSKRVVTGLLKRRMGFKGLVITDAMNMKAVKDQGDDAYSMALKAGIDLILHPESPERVMDVLYKDGKSLMPHIERAFNRVIMVKKRMRIEPVDIRHIGKKVHMDLSRSITRKSIQIRAQPPSDIKKVLSRETTMLVIDDDNLGSGSPLYHSIRRYIPGLRLIYVDNNHRDGLGSILRPISRRPLIIAVFSRISGFKGRAWLSRRLLSLLNKAVKASGCSVVLGFCCPYILRDIEADLVINGFSDTDVAQECSAELLYRIIRMANSGQG